MSFPEPELLTSLVSRVFRIEDVTSGDPQKGWILRYRGHLLGDDSAAAYDLLADSVRVYGLTPLFRKDGDKHIVFLVPSLPEPKKRFPLVNIVLFLLTVFSVMLAGASPEGTPPADQGAQALWLLKSIFTGWPFALSLLGILLAHEFGHYLMSRYHKTAATLPFFIPLPFSILGTMGAFIQMQAVPKNKRILFDIGVAGPLAGMVVAAPVLLFGLTLSHLGPIVQDPNGFIEGNSLLYLLSKYLVFGQLLPSPASLSGLPLLQYWLQYFFTGHPVPFGGTDVFIHPVAFAGWAGLLVTALNLIPVGTLDGGHITYALFGEKIRKAYPFILGLLAALGLVWSTWWIWALLLLWLGRVHAEPLDQITELDPPRRAVGWFAILLFVLVFSPVPMVLLG
ncbi:MAG: peptidase M50 [Anaerolineaceae bacterium]|nr:site-2 protease family protein [Chloroflexota bacterium]NOG76140.1 site-2 protease family protein [Chloroflexota bacterium]WKZ54772.1 MAG: site-2 protease family protein [Anaerolineales bacterium]GIK08854.1 MAG: peptidase M50 [Chloroflexota bacterium]GJQ38433.1 MAG: peptidase M50 [Anaerolineaceae bacterium]